MAPDEVMGTGQSEPCLSLLRSLPVPPLPVIPRSHTLRRKAGAVLAYCR